MDIVLIHIDTILFENKLLQYVNDMMSIDEGTHPYRVFGKYYKERRTIQEEELIYTMGLNSSFCLFKLQSLGLPSSGEDISEEERREKEEKDELFFSLFLLCLMK